ncbi:mechanosensitive ion channel [Echinicola jeungdonensis]|uniref:Mechanosensitive ion channel family protein n=1 Tax=Echinicola jeungdonensis TaxID=709343 RepID=A0ABV5J8G2_9BACT|nr:mechanosensitive ion channel [Echinicola jeungdonensis]MDN3669438.1 mechanosensitive ion channel [Echinicola jeungdonensis]
METVTNITGNFYSIITNKLNSWLETMIEMLPNFIVAVLITISFVIVAKIVRRGVKKLLTKFTDSPSLTTLISMTLYFVIVAIGIFVALSVLNLDKAVTSLLAGAGIIGLALGFAFQDIASNFMSGVMMAVRKPIRSGDLIETNDIFGTVLHVSLRSTELEDPQGQLYIIPNKMIFENPIKNYTKSGKRRVDLSGGISYGDNLRKVKEITTNAVETLEIIDKDKGIEFFFTEFGSSSINYVVRFWLKYSTTQSSYLDASSQSIIAIKEAYDQNDITIPFPIRTLDFGIKGGQTFKDMMPVEIQSNVRGNGANE